MRLDRAEFEVGKKVSFWNGKRFIIAAVTNVTLNPITKTIEYRLFYRERKADDAASRITITTTPYRIKESVHFNVYKR